MYRLVSIHKGARSPRGSTDQRMYGVNLYIVGIVLLESASVYTLTVAVLTVTAFLGSNIYYLIGGVVSGPMPVGFRPDDMKD